MKKAIVLVRSRYEFPSESNSIYLNSVTKDILNKYPNIQVEFHSIDSGTSEFSKRRLIADFTPKVIPAFLRIACSLRLYKDVFSLLGHLDIISKTKAYRFFVSIKIYLVFSYISAILNCKLMHTRDIAAFVVFGYYSSIELSFVYASSFHNIDVIDYQHGIIHSAHTPYSRMSNSPCLRPSHIFIWDEAFRQFFPRSFHSRTYLASYSELLKDIVASRKSSNRKRERSNASDSSITILISLCCHEVLPPSLFDFVKTSLDPQNNFNKFNFIFRLHPKTPDVNALPGELGHFLSVSTSSFQSRFSLTDKRTSLIDDIVSSDIHLTVYSSVAVQCSMCGVPSLCFPENIKLLPDCFELLPFIHRYNPLISLENQLHELLNPPAPSLPSRK
jgi:hypothetical protein